jgi:ADP-heptose:LPS heptosyltransferase
LRQKRSRAEKNEAQYNFDLVSFALEKKLKTPSLVTEPQLTVAAGEKFKLAQLKQSLNITKPYVVIHPGMAGSAENWPLTKYAELARELQEKQFLVLVTGTQSDHQHIAESGILNVPGVINLCEKTPPGLLLAVLSEASAVIAPSTGVVHLAASLGVKTLGIYSPVLVQSPRRWGPMGPQVQIFVPNVECPGQFNCLMEKCPHYNCMEQISVDSVASCVNKKQ